MRVTWPWTPAGLEFTRNLAVCEAHLKDGSAAVAAWNAELMKRILFCVPTGSVIGGIETWLDHVVPFLAERGWDPLVALARGLKYNRPERFREAHPDLPTVEMDGRGFDREGRIRAVQRVLRKVRPDIVMPLGLNDAYWAYFRWRKSGGTGRLVLRNQGILPELLDQVCLYGPHADLVVSDSRLVTRFAVEHAGIPAHRVRHLPNGADATRRPTTPGSARPVLRLGYVGRFSRRDKRVLDLIGLCQRLQEQEICATVDIVGSGPAEDELRRGLEKDAFRDMVRFHGRLSRDELYERIYPNLDVLLLFSQSESFGIVLVEAMMHGVVPVTSDYLGRRSERLVIHDATGLVFPVGDIQAASRLLASLAANHAMLCELSENARAKASEYTWQPRLAAWHDALRSLSRIGPLHSTPTEDLAAATPTGKLERLRLPWSVVDIMRRIRRSTLGTPIRPGGEEWPLFDRSRSARAASLAPVIAEIENRSNLSGHPGAA